MVWLSRPSIPALVSRRLIYLGVLLAVAMPMIWRVSFKEHASPMVRDVYATVEALPAESRVLLVFDFDPASAPEIRPMTNAFARHLSLKQAKLFCLTLWPTGPVEIQKAITEILKPEFPGRHYGVDYINLGYLSGSEGVIAVALTDFKKAFSNDTHNISTYDTERLPIMESVDNLSSFDLIVDASAGYPGLIEWIQYGSVPSGVRIVGGSVAVGSPELFPYIPDQCVGILTGLKGAAEYEQLLLEQYPQLDRPECRAALQRMGPQTVAHLVIILLILLGNLLHLLSRRRGAA
ncbi:MAG: hypothetical protein ABIF77_11835 [bacterium]